MSRDQAAMGHDMMVLMTRVGPQKWDKITTNRIDTRQHM